MDNEKTEIDIYNNEYISVKEKLDNWKKVSLNYLIFIYRWLFQEKKEEVKEWFKYIINKKILNYFIELSDTPEVLENEVRKLVSNILNVDKEFDFWDLSNEKLDEIVEEERKIRI